MRTLLLHCMFLLCSSFTFAQDLTGLKDGDIVFIVNSQGQGRAIQLATHSKYTHVGIVFFENGKPMVYHAVEPVMKSTLAEFISFSGDGRYEMRRLKDRSVLTDSVIRVMKKLATKELDKHYDLEFNWSDEEMYCSEYVWKIYKRALNIEVGQLKPLGSFDLSHPLVKEMLEERYDGKIPLNEKMISPGDMFESELVEGAKAKTEF
ncbi:MAG: peptidoglycan peptidase [Bacteroidia bacterium]|nr:peptidoglycan peptidase [Bacteroidia bacterium]